MPWIPVSPPAPNTARRWWDGPGSGPGPGPGSGGVTWWDGSVRQAATIYWWDGAVKQPCTVKGFWDGSAIQPIV